MADSRSPSYPASAARQPKPLCMTGPLPHRPLPAEVMNNPLRARAILNLRSKWLNKTVLHYAFFGGNSHYAVPKAQADVVRQAFTAWKGLGDCFQAAVDRDPNYSAAWKALGIGLEFKEVADLSEAEVRIGYSSADGSSASMVGKDVLQVPLSEPTTVYGWDLTTPYGRGTALHELGHVLGMEHEHQSPFAGIKWNEEAVYESLGRPPNNWSRQTTLRNILQKLDPQQVLGSTWDPDSIMEYEFERGLIEEPAKYQDGLVPPGTLSQSDKAWAQKWYPGDATTPATGELKAFQSVSADLQAGEQRDFVFKPTQSSRSTASRASSQATTTAAKTATPRSARSSSAAAATSSAFACITPARPAPPLSW